MKKAAIFLVIAVNYFIGTYYGIVNLVYTTLLSVALAVVLRHHQRIRYSPVRDYAVSPEIPPVTLLIPAHNEEAVILRTVRSALANRYPDCEIIVVNDGSTDATLPTLVSAFGLRRVDRVYRKILPTGEIRGFFYNPRYPSLLVLDKVQGGKADALNCGINVSRSPYFCTVDADSILEEDAVLRLMTPVLESAVPVVACSGVIRVLNGLSLAGDRVDRIELPKSHLARFQVVEYLRAFLFGRIGLDAIHGILILSGAFSLFHKASVVEAGGYRLKHVTEDLELILRLHVSLRSAKKRYRIQFIPDPICWTEVPESFEMLARQRRRWHMGLFQSIWQYRRFLLNPRHGRLGLLIFPYHFFIEAISPIVEVLGYIVVPISWYFGLMSLHFFLLFLALAILYGVFLSTASILLEEMTYRRYPKWNHLFTLLLYGVLENFGYRQMNSLWRCQAVLKLLLGMRKWEYVVKGIGKDRPKR